MVPMSVLGLGWCPHTGWSVVFVGLESGRQLKIGVPLRDALILGSELIGQRTERSALYELVCALIDQPMHGACVQLAPAEEGRVQAALVLSPKDPRIAYPTPIADAVTVAGRARLPIFVDDALVEQFGIGGEPRPDHVGNAELAEATVPLAFHRALGGAVDDD